MKNHLIAFALLLLVSSGCKKSVSKSVIPGGSYTGILEITSEIRKEPLTYPIAISFENDKYNISPDPARKLGGSGTYSYDGNIGNFKDENVWPASADSNLILNGEYEIQSKGNNLILKKQFKGNIPIGPAVTIIQVYYKYILTKNK